MRGHRPLDQALLRVLTHSDGEMFGHELLKAIESEFWCAWLRIHPALSRLEDAGLILGRTVPNWGRPTLVPRRLYRLTYGGHFV